MKSFCIHEPFLVADKEIWEPNYSKDMVYINVSKIHPNTKHFAFKFKRQEYKEEHKKYAGWHYLDANVIRKQHIQDNGRGAVFTVPFRLCEKFEPIARCEHAD